MADIGFVKIKEVIKTTDRARLIKFEDGRELWMPETVIRSYDPNTKIMKFETWMLKQKSIKYKLK